MWNKLHDSANGYFSTDGVPYHSPETLIIEAPDYGHETTSEAFSYWLWLEANYGKLTGDWSKLNAAWAKLDATIIPAAADQPTTSFYNAGSPATYAAEHPLPDDYPSTLTSSVPVGQDPIAGELKNTYGTSNIYGMHWLLDVDNWYGFGNHSDGTSHNSYINTFQRGPQESVWETVPQPEWDTFKWGGPSGFLALFTTGGSYAKQWRYTDAPDADSRAVQALYWASTWATQQASSAVLPTAKAAELGDFLRYAFFDKYFKVMNCQSESCAGGTGYASAHYLLSWYYAWGGATDTSAGWSWRIGASHVHFGYQNPLAAWALSSYTPLKPASPNGANDWKTSLQRQLEFYTWLQSSEGAFAGGATNSWNGNYSAYPAGTSTFYGMAYDFEPVYHDPPSNSWFGWQAWSVQRLAEYYYVTGDAKAKVLLDKWVAWVKSVVKINSDGTYAIPSTLDWSGQPDTWNPAVGSTGNPNLHVIIKDYTQDVGVTASLARALMNYSAGTKKWTSTQDVASQTLAKNLIDREWTLYSDSKGVSNPETRSDYSRIFTQTVFVPSGFSGTMPDGDQIVPGATFLSIRSKYKQDPGFADVQTAYNNGTLSSKVFYYHRFWAESEVALANADYARLFP
jgi:hypothetical protein